MESVEILENHQPIRALDSLEYSDRTSLNIKLKNNITTSGTIKLGVGFPLMLWEGNATPMIFNRNRQMISSYQTNNTGEDVTKDLNSLTVEDLEERLGNRNEKEDWVMVQALSKPDFEQERILFNNVHLLTTNYLVRMRNDSDLRVNASYLNDKQIQEGARESIYFLANDTIGIKEATSNNFLYRLFKSEFALIRNQKQITLKIVLK